MGDILYLDFSTDTIHTYLGVENCSTLFAVVCRPNGPAVFHWRNTDQLSVGCNGEWLESDTTLVAPCATVSVMDSAVAKF